MARNLPARAGAQLPANWEAQIAADAKKAKDAEANTGGGQWLSIRNGVLAFQGNPLPNSSIEAVVVDYRFENAFFVGTFDPEKFTPPVCYAVAEDEDSLVPAENVHDQQHDKCKGCKQNDFGTSERGRGKACKNMRRLALLHTDYLDGDIEKAPLVGLKVPPTSLTGWAEYVKKLANVFDKPPYCFIVRITASPDPKVQVRVSFELVEEVKDKKILGAIFARRADAKSLLDTGYEWSDDPQPRRGGQQQQRVAGPKSRKDEKPKRAERQAPPPPARKGGAAGAQKGFGKF